MDPTVPLTLAVLSLGAESQTASHLWPNPAGKGLPEDAGALKSQVWVTEGQTGPQLRPRRERGKHRRV